MNTIHVSFCVSILFCSPCRHMALLQRQLAFKRGLEFEAGGLEKTQGISRPWIYSYFTLLQALSPPKAETTIL